MKTPVLKSQKYVKLLENIIQALDLNMQIWGGKINCETNIYMKHSTAEQRTYSTKNAHVIKHSTNPPSVVLT